jgi:hypothetical protein
LLSPGILAPTASAVDKHSCGTGSENQALEQISAPRHMTLVSVKPGIARRLLWPTFFPYSRVSASPFIPAGPTIGSGGKYQRIRNLRGRPLSKAMAGLPALDQTPY